MNTFNLELESKKFLDSEFIIVNNNYDINLKIGGTMIIVIFLIILFLSARK